MKTIQGEDLKFVSLGKIISQVSSTSQRLKSHEEVKIQVKEVADARAPHMTLVHDVCNETAKREEFFVARATRVVVCAVSTLCNHQMTSWLNLHA